MRPFGFMGQIEGMEEIGPALIGVLLDPARLFSRV